MKYFLIVLTFLVQANHSKAQSAEEAVKLVINQMFAAMKNADAQLLQSTFSENMVLQTIGKDKDGAWKVYDENPDDFIKQVNTISPGDYDERIEFETIRIDGPLAFAWMPYTFYLKGKFSHCGVNAFQLVRFADGWKIQSIIDTRRNKGCDATK